MRDDLLDAQSAVDWAVSQIPVLQNKLAAWNAKRPYRILVEIDPQTSVQSIIADLIVPVDYIVMAETGVIINSMRTALDLLAASLTRRNGKKPDRGTHFPIFDSDQCMIDPLHGIEGKKWLSKGERATIKAIRPYQGGDHTVWPLHQLDILRKHTRFISARPDVSRFHIQSGYSFMSGMRGIERLENKTVLARFGGSGVSFDVANANMHVAAHVTFDEAGIGLTDEEVAITLLRFAGRVVEIIKLFDT